LNSESEDFIRNGQSTNKVSVMAGGYTLLSGGEVDLSGFNWAEFRRGGFLVCFFSPFDHPEFFPSYTVSKSADTQ
jgi:hypothetical protein